MDLRNNRRHYRQQAWDRKKMTMAMVAVVVASVAATIALAGPTRLPGRRRPAYPYIKKEFQLDDLEDTKCIYIFRFNQQEIRRLIRFLRIEEATYPNRITPSPEAAMCTVLYHLSDRRSLGDMTMLFGRSRRGISVVFNSTLVHINRFFHWKLRWDETRLTLDQLYTYEQAVREAGGVSRIWGFVDGTVRPIAKPGTIDQRLMFSGYKKTHGFKYQGIVTPDGLISSLIGPRSAKTGDWLMWQETDLEMHLRALMGHLPRREVLNVYGDQAYTAGGYGIIGALAARLNGPGPRERRAFNTAMSRLRINVENGFGRVTQLWQATDWKRGLTIGNSPAAAVYMVAVLLTNCRTCLDGHNQIAVAFDLEPPSLEDYLGNMYYDPTGLYMA